MLVTDAEFLLDFGNVAGAARLRTFLRVRWHDEQAGRLHDMQELTGELAALVLSFFRQQCPYGVVLDRLEEYPEEARLAAEDTASVVAFLRAQHEPTYIYTDDAA